jgi:hypothetical protein
MLGWNDASDDRSSGDFSYLQQKMDNKIAVEKRMVDLMIKRILFFLKLQIIIVFIQDFVES